jgi:hypothetical protein
MSTTPTVVSPNPPIVSPIAPLVSLRTKIELVAISIFLAGGIVFAYTLRSERQARQTAEAGVKVEQEKMKADDIQIAQLQAQDKIRDSQTADEIQAAEAKAAAAKTPAQIVAYLKSQLQLAGAPAPIAIETPAPTAQDPTPPAIATIPAVDLPFLRDEVANCSTNAIRVPDLTQDLASCKSQLQLAGEKLSEAEKERDDWKTAAKGGTWAKRIKSGAIKVGIGIAIGVAADEAAHHK